MTNHLCSSVNGKCPDCSREMKDNLQVEVANIAFGPRENIVKYYPLLERISSIDLSWEDHHDASVAASEYRDLLMSVLRGEL